MISKYQEVKDLYFGKKYNQALLSCQDLFDFCGWDSKVGLLYIKILKGLRQEEECIDFITTNLGDFEQEDIVKVKKELLTLLCKFERYDEALVIVGDLLSGLEKDDLNPDAEYNKLNRIKMSILKLTNPDEFHKLYPKVENGFYVEGQLVNYSREKAIRKIEKKCYDSKKKLNVEWFFVVEDKLGELEPKLKDSDKYVSTIFDYYYIYDPACAKFNGKICNYIQVATIKDTTDIVKILPCTYTYLPNNKQEYSFEQENYQKKDMIKRFYDRYNKKSK